ncbi:MAG: NTP transferase domain-containing protein [bacterium]
MTVVAILAGGRSSRMARPKAMVELGGRPLISYPLRAAREAGLEALVVAKRGSQLPQLECEVVLEPREPTHPLAGILAALGAAAARVPSSSVIALGCDMPFVNGELLSALARRDPPAAVARDGGLEPLLALYGQDQRESLAAALERRAPLRAALTALRPDLIDERELVRFGDPARLSFSVNSATDLERAEAMLAGGALDADAG